MKIIVFILSFLLILSPVRMLESNDQVYREVLPEQINDTAYPVIEGEKQSHFISINSGQRLTTDDPDVIKKWIEQINESKGFNIVFLGDSIVYGDGTTDEYKTIPSLLRQKLLESETGQVINIFNLTLPSAGPAEVYLITRELVKVKVDLIIYDMNIGWLDRDEILEHPVLLKLGDNKDLDPAAFKVENLDEVTPNYYNLYDEDDNLKDLATSWNQKSWEGILNSKDMGKFGRIHLEWSEQWKYVQKTVALLKEHKINSLFFANPRNFDLLEEYDIIDYQSYNTTLQTVFNYLSNSGVTTLNLDRAVPSEYFSDLVHLLPEGEDIISSRLCDFIVQTQMAMEDTKS